MTNEPAPGPVGLPELVRLAEPVIAAAVRSGRSVATAESLTGGLLGAALTGVSGASAVYRGGLITYATDLKASLGGVDAEELARHGAVSAQTARGMAAGAAARCGADIGIALTGVAGPDPQEGHPAGTVFCGWYAAAGAEHRELRLAGDRAEIRYAAAAAALGVLTGLLDSE